MTRERAHWRQWAADGLWHNNPALVQVIGLCPLLAVTGTLANGLGLGLATLVVLALSNLMVSLIRRQLTPAIRLPMFVLVIASTVSAVELLMQALAFGMYQVLGIFIPLIVTNCAILGRAEAFASRHAPLPALWDGLFMGAGFLLVLVVLGGLRELVGQGTLGDGLHLLLGPVADGWVWHAYAGDGVLVALLPPGAFFGLALLIAAKNALAQPAPAPLSSAAERAARRVRMTDVTD